MFREHWRQRRSKTPQKFLKKNQYISRNIAFWHVQDHQVSEAGRITGNIVL